MSTEEDIVQAQTFVMRDLVDVLLGEDLFDLHRRRNRPPESLAEWGLGPGEQWYRIDLADGWVAWRVRCSAALQDYRLSGTEVWASEHHDSAAIRTVAPDELLAMLLADRVQYAGDCGGSDGESDTHGTIISAAGGAAAAAVDDLRTAVQHAAVTIRQRRSMGNAVLQDTVGLVAGERLAATRDRPFHPTGRATVGWDMRDRERYGPMRRHPIGLAWVAVDRSMLRRGGEPDARRLHQLVLNDSELAALEEFMGKANVDTADYQPLPVHPWQFEHVLGSHFGAELASRSVVPLTNDLGRFTPTASIRTLAMHPEGPLHLKLPLGIATLGATRLLPPRYLDNGERAQRVMTDIIGRTDALRGLVDVCDETNWCSWQDQDEFAYRPGHLAAQVRRYPVGLFDDPDLRVLPMAALAAHEWDVLDGILGVVAVDGGPVEFFGAVAEALCVLGFGFLGCGVLPELHGQNVVIALRGAVVERLVLRDHDTLRIHPEWMRAADIDEPGYRVKPGAPQSLVLASGCELVGYLQTLGFQINLYGIAGAMAHHFGIDESAFWIRLRAAVIDALDRVELPGVVAGVVSQALLSEPDWPSRQVFGPLLRRGASREVSMPAATGRVPNPLRDITVSPRKDSAGQSSWQLATDGAVGGMAEHAALSALLNAFLRETRRCGAMVVEDDSEFRVELPSTGQVLCGTIEYWSPMGFHRYGHAFTLAHADSGELAASAHNELVHALVAETAHGCTSAGRVPAQAQMLVEQIADSVQRITRYLDQPRTERPTEPHALTRYAEQSLRLGHPMHPTPKSSPGFTDTDSTAYAPELGAGFALHYVAIEQDVLRDDRVAPAMWIPDAVLDAASQFLDSRRGDYRLLPVHPWQARYLEQRAAFRRLVERDAVVPLGALGEPAYPTSSVRTVCDPRFTSAWKLPLRVRITNFFRTNPLEHIQRAADASRVISSLRSDSASAGLEILIETGYRTVRDPELGEDLAVLFRENPFAESQFAPQVLAALLEDRPGALPDLVGYLREAAGLSRSSVEPVAAEVTIEWFRRYLAISVLPILDLWAEHGVSLEAHTQNSLVHLQDGWPSRCYVRDMEGVSISRRARPLIDLVSADSPLVYDDDAAWLRLRYYLVTNHIGHLVHVLSRCGRTTEYQLWGVLADVLAEHERSSGNPYLVQLRRASTLPAKANLISRLAERGERPLYVEVPNPIVK